MITQGTNSNKMNSSIFVLILLGVIILITSCTILKNKNQEEMNQNNNIGLPISKVDFDQYVQTYLNKLNDSNDSLSIDDYIILTRIWNTIEINNLNDENKLYNEIVEKYYPKIFEEATKLMKAKLSKGMAMYSEEYDLWFGGRPHGNSQFKIKE